MIKLGKDAKGEMQHVNLGETIITSATTAGGDSHTHSIGFGDGEGNYHNSAMHDPPGNEAQEQPYLRMDDSDITPLKMFKIPAWMGGVRLRHFSVTNMSWLPFSGGVAINASSHSGGASGTGTEANLVYSPGATLERQADNAYKFTSTSGSQDQNPPLFGVAYSTNKTAMHVQATTDTENAPSIATTVHFLGVVDDVGTTPWTGWPAKTTTAVDAANSDGQAEIMTYRWGEKTGTTAYYVPTEKTADISVAVAPGNYVMIYCKGAIMARNYLDPMGSLGVDTTHYGAVFLNRDAYLRFDCTLLCDAMPPVP